MTHGRKKAWPRKKILLCLAFYLSILRFFVYKMRILFLSQSTQLVDSEAAYKSSAPERCSDCGVVSVFLTSAAHSGEEFPSQYFRRKDIIQGTCRSLHCVENSPDIETLQCHGCFFFSWFLFLQPSW